MKKNMLSEPADNKPEEIINETRTPDSFRKGLVLEGGAMRGMFTCGVTDVMMENNIKFDGIVGVSAGAVFGCNVKSGQIGRGLRYNKRFCADKRYASFSSLLKTGDFFGKEFCYHQIPDELDPFDRETFKENPCDFWCVATDLESGRAVYHKCSDGGENDMEWLRASASMPLFSGIVEIGERKLLDGGVADSIPLRFFEHKEFNKNVVVLTQALNYIKGENKFLPLIAAKYKAYPEFVKAMALRHVRYNRDTEYIRNQELNGKAFVIRPDESLGIGHVEHDPNELERVYSLGRDVMERRLDELKYYLEK